MGAAVGFEAWVLFVLPALLGAAGVPQLVADWYRRSRPGTEGD